jgi:hypothetical protein
MMHDIKYYSAAVTPETNSFKLYGILRHHNLISDPVIFFDKKNVLTPLPEFHSRYLMSQNYLILTDNTCYDIADTFKSNKFICIDIPTRHNLSNVDHYNIEDFLEEKGRLDQLKKILSNKEYQNYVVQNAV